MVSDCPTLPALTQNCRVLVHFTDDSGASLEMNLSPTLAKMACSKTQGWSSESSSRGGVATPDCNAWFPVRELPPGKQAAQIAQETLGRTCFFNSAGAYAQVQSTSFDISLVSCGRLRHAFWAWFWFEDHCTPFPGLCRLLREI